MDRLTLINQIVEKNSYLCVGLDTDQEKLPIHLKNDPDGILKFNKAIIEATLPYTVSYKINTAFYEAMGTKGWELLEKTLEMLPENVFTIADAKRGDIGNTSDRYAKAFFSGEGKTYDSLTIAPYMGEDSVKPFLEYPGKWAILLALTSNVGAMDFQFIKDENGKYLFESVIEKAVTWGNSHNLMFVAGATRGEYLSKVRELAKEYFLLVPGVGAQGGSLEEVSRLAMTKDCGLLVNSSRGIIYASSGEDFAEKAAEAAQKIQKEMEEHLATYMLAVSQ
ncbi:MAG: orotidine-5'-phosphate decarboxylase [Sphingobacteriales bacterium]|jgi:orotidine-5'-phosphate decarboxylase